MSSKAPSPEGQGWIIPKIKGDAVRPPYIAEHVSDKDTVDRLQKKLMNKVAGKLKRYAQRRREEKKQYDGGRRPRSQRSVKTTVGALFQLEKLR